MYKWMVSITSAFIIIAAGTVPAATGILENMKGQVLNECQGKFKGKRPTPEELKIVLNDHIVWITRKFDTQEEKFYLRMANLCGAVLPGANLRRVVLSRADLSGADLTGANLSGASLPNANLSGARLHSANLSGVVFQPKELPDLNEISNAKNLWTMIFFDNPQPLVRLRKAFKESGYYQQEREVTCAIERNVTEDLFKKKLGIVSLFEGVFRYVFFDLTCQYGMAPSRALLILISLIPVFAIPYVIALYLPGQNGIWRKWADDRMRVDIGTKEPTHIRVGWLQAFSLGLYFSVLSAFNIGWREFNVGNWIQHLQAKEYTLRATGWVRTFSGVQSLISVYLLAIWVLTYFGRPFN